MANDPKFNLIPLPIDSYMPQVGESLRAVNNLVLVAEPGAGKTTRVPPALLPLLIGAQRNLVILQPRRVAARAAAMRIAEERGWTLGREVGYHIRFDRMIGADTRLRVLTEGILTRQLLNDATLDGVGCVVLDEFHERSIHIDLALAMLREVQQTIRPDLKLVVMSATLDAEPVAAYLDGAPIVRVPGRLFPIEIDHRQRRHDRDVVDQVVDELTSALRGGSNDGDVLVFLPGVGEINGAIAASQTLAREFDLLLLPLHGSLPNNEQLRALKPAKQRKVIFATNIAETSLTIDGVTCVIDAGLHRMAGFDARRGMDTLSLSRISQASAAQRAGRAGRTRPGRAIRLWSAKEHNELPAFDLPELSRVDLAPTVLALHAWGCADPREFAFFQPPPPHMLSAAERLLFLLGALDAAHNGKLTELGRAMLAFPAHPRLARLLLAADAMELRDTGAQIAALLSEKDILRDSNPREMKSAFRAPKDRADSDIEIRLQILNENRFDDRIDRTALAQVRRAIEQYNSAALYSGNRVLRAKQGESNSAICPLPCPSPGVPEEGVRKLIALAYPDRICRIRDRAARTGTMVGGGGVKIGAESAVVDTEFFVAVDARHNPAAARAESIVRIASRVEREWLDELFPQSIRRETTAEFDSQRQRVVGVSRVYYLDLLLDEQLNAPVDDETASRVLAEALAPRAVDLISRDERAANFIARLELLRTNAAEFDWPALDGPRLVEIVTEACRGRRAVADVSTADLLDALRARLVYPLDRKFEDLAPETITVPTGNRLRLTYSRGDKPRLAVRLQELFGMPATPRICNGRVPVLLELLGPNYRPVQVTDDLASFWKNTYPQVRKDLRARYPKHSWPEDPLTAPPISKGRPTK